MTVWEEIVRDYSPAIWKTVYRLVGNRDDAADCVQETFLSAMRHGNSKPIQHWGAFAPDRNRPGTGLPAEAIPHVSPS